MVSAIKNAASIRVDDRWINLYGISDPKPNNDSSHVQVMIKYLIPTKGVVDCYKRTSDTYQCYAGDADLAIRAIEARIALPLPDAPSIYLSAKPSAGR
jgi:hypothetical protein